MWSWSILAEFRGEVPRSRRSRCLLHGRDRRWKLQHRHIKQSVVPTLKLHSLWLLKKMFLFLSEIPLRTRQPSPSTRGRVFRSCGVQFSRSSLTRGGSEQCSLGRLRHLKYWIRDVFRAKMSNPASSTVYLLQSAMLLNTTATATAHTHTQTHTQRRGHTLQHLQSANSAGSLVNVAPWCSGLQFAAHYRARCPLSYSKTASHAHFKFCWKYFFCFKKKENYLNAFRFVWMQKAIKASNYQ